jgi:hypothetical protein
MKTSLIVVLGLMLIGCQSSRQSTSLTAEQAKALAMRLANDRLPLFVIASHFTMECRPLLNQVIGFGES